MRAKNENIEFVLLKAELTGRNLGNKLLKGN